MADDPTAEAPVQYPAFVATAEQRRRWDLSRLAAEKTADMIGGNAETVWLATRSIYNSDIPTDPPEIPSEG